MWYTVSVVRGSGKLPGFAVRGSRFGVRGSGFGLAWHGGRGAGGAGAGVGRGQGEKIKPRGGATNNRMDDKATPHMSEPNCAALGHPTPEIFVA